MPCVAAGPDTELSNGLRQRLEAHDAGISLTVNGRPLQVASVVQEFYTRRLYRPVWFADGRLLEPAHSIPPLLASSTSDGLRPEEYSHTSLTRAITAYRAGELPMAPVDLELRLTAAVLAYSSDMLRGRVHPENLYSSWEADPRDLDLAGYLQTALEAGTMVSSLHQLAPEHPHYQRLSDLLSSYRQIESSGGLVTVPPGATLKAGIQSERVAALRRRLLQSGDLPPGEPSPEADVFDAALQAGLERYQARHGLEPDGVAGPKTLESLGTPAAERIRTIELNMERWRWLPQHLGDRYITVNIAGFQLNVVENGSISLSKRVVVGKRYHATPVFTDTMTYLVFSPYWHVPSSIAVNEILPKLREDPGYLESESMKVFRGWEQSSTPLDPTAIDWTAVDAKNFPYRFRQEPGPQNALGQVKFMFPNKYNVYLHDTPAKTLFSRAARDFSHGCIRLSEPLELAEFLLRDHEGWDAQRIEAAAGRGSEQTVRLPRAWPVHLLYWTAWVDSEGRINFRPDVYGRDERLAEALYN